MSRSCPVPSAKSLEADDVEEALPPLNSSIWECPHVKRFYSDSGEKRWRCLWCPDLEDGSEDPGLSGHNATKALYHVCQVKGGSVRPCKGNIPKRHKNRYMQLYHKHLHAVETRQSNKKRARESIGDSQERIRKHRKSKVSLASTPACDITPLGSRQLMYSPLRSGNDHGRFNSATTSPAFARGGQVGVRYDADAPQKLDIAFADYVHSNLLAFSQGECMKAQRVIDIARTLPPDVSYKLPHRHRVSGDLLDDVASDNWNTSIKDLLKETRIMGCSIMADGATIDKDPLYNVIAASVNNPMAILDIIDLSDMSARGEKKDGKALADLMSPLILKLEKEQDSRGRPHPGIVDMCAVDGAGNVQKAAEILSIRFPRITVIHGAEHALDLFYSEVYSTVEEFSDIKILTRAWQSIGGPDVTSHPQTGKRARLTWTTSSWNCRYVCC